MIPLLVVGTVVNVTVGLPGSPTNPVPMFSKYTSPALLIRVIDPKLTDRAALPFWTVRTYVSPDPDAPSWPVSPVKLVPLAAPRNSMVEPPPLRLTMPLLVSRWLVGLPAEL